MWSPKARNTVGQAGFTLLELLTALTVVSVAVGILVMLAGRVGDLYREAEFRATATDLVMAKLAEVTRAPASFRWQQDEQGDRLVVIPAGENLAVDYPFTTLPDQWTSRGTFRWRAFARPLENMPDVMELTVVVTWLDSGREQSFALTAPMPAGDAMQRAGALDHEG